MALTPEQIEAVTLVAEQTRTDFEEGKIPDTEIEEITRLYNVGHWVTNHSGVYMPVGDKFPVGWCGHASPILKQRIDESRILEREVELIEGGYWNDSFSLNDEWHTFVRLEQGRSRGLESEPELDTIVDITADQYRSAPKVYVGPLQLPWTDTPRIDLWET